MKQEVNNCQKRTVHRGTAKKDSLMLQRKTFGSVLILSGEHKEKPFETAVLL